MLHVWESLEENAWSCASPLFGRAFFLLIVLFCLRRGLPWPNPVSTAPFYSIWSDIKYLSYQAGPVYYVLYSRKFDLNKIHTWAMVLSSPSSLTLVATQICFSGKQMDLSCLLSVVLMHNVGLKNSAITHQSYGTVWGIWQLFVNVFDSLMKFWKKSQWSKKGFYGVPPVTQNNHQAFQGCLSIPLLWDCPRFSFQDLSEGYSCYRSSSEGRRDLFNICNSQALHSAKDFKTTLPYYYAIFLSSLVVTQMPTISYSFEMHIYVSLVS